MSSIKNLGIALFFVCFLNSAFSQNYGEIDNMRSDTLDVLKYSVQIDFTTGSTNFIQANCEIDFKAKMNNISGISLDLLRLTVDSVKSEGINLNYTYNDTLLRVTFPNELMNGEEKSITVYYQGNPVVDASSFGGFYSQSGYVYNMGVGFAAKPHNFGRVWHPCFDNFVERATYDIELITHSDKTGYSNGYIVSKSVNESGQNVRKWRLSQEIPSYLACFGVASYTHVEQEYISNLNSESIPVILAAQTSDTTKLKNSFVHLFDAMDIYQSSYGPYLWDKIGYAVVPFNGGAMEHATLIMYPKFAVNGNLQYETLMAHELAHHWWGNLVTCRTGEDMWINEGLASYSEVLFLEHLYGYDSYINELKTTHRDVIQKAHYQDGGFLSISGVPHEATYGSHTYSKGSTIMHNLRTYMGDESFFDGLHAIQEQYKFKDINAEEFRDVLTNSTDFDATDFFDDFIFSPGFNGYEIDSFSVNNLGGNYEVSVYIQQKLFETPNFFKNAPIQVTFLGENGEEHSVVEIIPEQFHDFTATLTFLPKMVYLNKDYGLLNAVTGENYTIENTATYTKSYSYSRIKVTEIEEPTFIRIEHYRLPPDGFQNEIMNDYIIISPDRYWKIDGISTDGLKGELRFTFNSQNSASGNLDVGLFIDHEGLPFHEDSIVLLWRPNQATEWSIHPNYEIKTLASLTDGSGYIDTKEFRLGEYTFGLKKNSLGSIQENWKNEIKVYPNPTQDELKIEWDSNQKKRKIAIYSIDGKLMCECSPKEAITSINTSSYNSGVYTVIFYEKGKEIGTQKFIKY